MRRLLLPLVAAAAGLLAVAPAHAEKLPQVTPDGLVLQPRTKFSAVYLKPGASFAQYDKFAILAPYIEFEKGWMQEQNEDVPFSVTPQYMNQVKKELSAEFLKRFTKVLSEKGGFPVVSTGAADVLVLRPAIVDLDITAPDTMQPGVTSFAASAGSATLYMEIYDSVSNTLLARIYDAESAENGVAWSGGVGNVVAADQMLDHWAELLRRALEDMRKAAGESPNAPPAATSPQPAPAPAK